MLNEPYLTLVCLWQAPSVLHHIMNHSGVVEFTPPWLDIQYI
jgi:hypothetical protein